MSFKKYADVQVIAIADGDFDEQTKKIAFHRNASHSMTASFYQSSPVNIDVQTALNTVASEYDISNNPNDYIFEAVRAVTAEVPNQNGDAFPKNELLRFDHRLNRSVYQTFVLKPHHINHRTDNPRTARGLILDASYNALSEPMSACPNCNSKTAAKEDRDDIGLHCRKCGHLVKDEFVELLLAIDKKKDPTFAEGVRAGALDSVSMGCDCMFTDCSICGNRARSVSQFCQHIKSGNKKKIFKTASGPKMAFENCGDVIFTEISRVDQPADPTAKQREILSAEQLPMAVESELFLMSAKIAKLEAMVKNASSNVGPIDVSPQIPFRTIAESISWAESSIAKLRGHNANLLSEKEQKDKSASSEGRAFYAWEKAAFDSQIIANNKYITRLETFTAKAKEFNKAGKTWNGELTRSMSRFFASKDAQLDDGSDAGDTQGPPSGQANPAVPGVQDVSTQGQPGQSGDMSSAHDAIDKMLAAHPDLVSDKAMLDLSESVGHSMDDSSSMEQITDKHEKDRDKNVSLAEFGAKPDDSMRPPSGTSGGGSMPSPNTPGAPKSGASNNIRASTLDSVKSDLSLLLDSVKENRTVNTKEKALRFASAYKDLDLIVTKSGNAKVFTPDGTLFVIRPEVKFTNADDANKFGMQVMANIAENGLVDTVNKYKVVLGPKIAQVLQFVTLDHADGVQDGDKKPHHADGENDMQEERATPPESMIKEESTDAAEAHVSLTMSSGSVIKDHEADHTETVSKAPDKVAKEEHSDRRDEREKSPKTTLEDELHDRAAALKTASPQEKKHVSRLERLYKSRLEKISADNAKAVEQTKKSVVEKVSNKFLRAVKLASKRQALNIEASPLKTAMFDVLSSELDLDSESFYPGMDSVTAAHIVEATANKGFDQFTDTLVKRATELFNLSDDAFNAIESDVKNLRPFSVSVPASDITAGHKNAHMKQAAIDGNLQLAPSSSNEIISNNDRRDNIRSALGSTKVRRASKTLFDKK